LSLRPKITGPSRISHLNSIFPDTLFVHIIFVYIIFVHIIRDGRALANSLLKVACVRSVRRDCKKQVALTNNRNGHERSRNAAALISHLIRPPQAASIEEAHTTVAIFSSAAAVGATALLVQARWPLHDGTVSLAARGLGLTLLLIHLPELVGGALLADGEDASWTRSRPALTWGTWLLLTLLGGLSDPWAGAIGAVLSIVGVAAALHTGARFVPSRGRAQLISTLAIPLAGFVFGVWIGCYVWGDKYLWPIEEVLWRGRGNLDTLFHASIANMLRTYGAISTGLDGLPSTPYHFGSHFVFGRLSALTGASVYRFYNELYPILVVPLFAHAVLEFAVTARGLRRREGRTDRSWHPRYSAIFWITYAIAMVGFLPPSISEALTDWNSHLTSESYALGVVLALPTLALATHLRGSGRATSLPFVLSVMIVACGMIKISFAPLLLCAAAWAVLRLGWWRSPRIWAALFLAGLALLGLLKFTAADTGEGIFFFHFVRTWVPKKWRAVYPLYLWAWPLVLVLRRFAETTLDGWQAFGNRLKAAELLDVEIAVVIAIAGVVPGMVLAIGGGSAWYFSDVQRWVSVGLVMSLPASALAQTAWARRVGTAGLVVVCLLGSAGAAWRARSNFETYGARLTADHERREWVAPTPAIAKLERDFEEIARLSLPIKRRSATVVPRNDRTYWDLHIQAPPSAISFLVPAWTGVAAIGGFTEQDELSRRLEGQTSFYSLSSYKGHGALRDDDTVEACRRAKTMGATRIIVLDEAASMRQLSCN
jgi:hypothetical protein